MQNVKCKMQNVKLNRQRIFNSYSSYLKDKYGFKTYRVSIDAGFSCPNRGKDRSGHGCSFCDERGSRAPYLGKEADIKKQVREGIHFLKKRYGASIFLLYFQAFSNTNASAYELKRIYDYALSLFSFRELIVSTRPDCITKHKAALLGAYKKEDFDVWVELGLQSASDKTLERINRGHCVEEFITSFKLLKAAGLKVAVHLIFGLPGEDISDIMNTVKLMACLKPDGIKIHNLHIPFGTEMYKEYLQGEIIVPQGHRHLEYTIMTLERFPPETVIMRLTCDTPASRLAAPVRFWEKSFFYDTLQKEMKTRNTWQGRLYS